jgi:hypothetical protein
MDARSLPGGMGVDRAPPADGAGTTPIALSTGQTVDLPLSLSATMLGAVFAAPREGVADLLPDGLRPIRATPDGRAAVTLLGVEYHRVGVEGIDPYDEFAVIVPAVHGDGRTVPYLSVLNRATSGHVHFLPVTTEPAKALGTDVWGYPKVVADIEHSDRGDRRRTTVSLDGERVLSLEVTRPPSIRRREDGYTYSTMDGDLLYTPTEADGELGGWPYSDAVSVAVGPHDRAAPLERLDLGPRALARVSVEGELTFHAGEPVGEG